MAETGLPHLWLVSGLGPDGEEEHGLQRAPAEKAGQLGRLALEGGEVEDGGQVQGHGTGGVQEGPGEDRRGERAGVGHGGVIARRGGGRPWPWRRRVEAREQHAGLWVAGAGGVRHVQVVVEEGEGVEGRGGWEEGGGRRRRGARRGGGGGGEGLQDGKQHGECGRSEVQAEVVDGDGGGGRRQRWVARGGAAGLEGKEGVGAVQHHHGRPPVVVMRPPGPQPRAHQVEVLLVPDRGAAVAHDHLIDHIGEEAGQEGGEESA